MIWGLIDRQASNKAYYGRKSLVRCVVALVIVGVILGATASVAFAGSAYSPNRYYGPIAGHSYYNNAGVHTNPPSSGAHASTGAFRNPQGTVPAGYIGVMARLYNDSGVLVRSTEYRYNPSPSIGLTTVTSKTYTRDTYYSYGITRAYTGSGYSSVSTYTSPYQNY